MYSEQTQTRWCMVVWGWGEEWWNPKTVIQIWYFFFSMILLSCTMSPRSPGANLIWSDLDHGLGSRSAQRFLLYNSNLYILSVISLIFRLLPKWHIVEIQKMKEEPQTEFWRSNKNHHKSSRVWDTSSKWSIRRKHINSDLCPAVMLHLFGNTYLKEVTRIERYRKEDNIRSKNGKREQRRNFQDYATFLWLYVGLIALDGLYLDAW